MTFLISCFQSFAEQSRRKDKGTVVILALLGAWYFLGWLSFVLLLAAGALLVWGLGLLKAD